MRVNTLYNLLDKYRFCENDGNIKAKLKRAVRIFIYFEVNYILPIWYQCTKRYNRITQQNCTPGIVVSLTSFPKRIGTVWITIESIIRQKTKPEKVILWLSEEQLPSKDCIPNSLWEQCERGLEIRFVKGDIRSYKKYVYAFQEFPDKYIITTDDDIVYPTDMVGGLYEIAKNNPKSVACCFSCKIRWDENDRCIYQMPQETPVDGSGYNVFYGTGGGTIFKPSEMDPDAANIELCTSLCPSADDFFLNGITRLSGCKIIIFRNSPILTIFIKNDEKLNDSNGTMFGGNSANTKQLRAFVEYYEKTRSINPFSL